MHIDIYKSTVNGEKYISVAKGTKIESLVFPDSIDPDILTLSPLRTRLEVNRKKPHPVLDQDDVIGQIEEKGFAVHGVKSTIQLGKMA